MNFPKELRYTKTHEWAKKDGSLITVGITDYAQKEISDVVFVEVPKMNAAVEKGKPMAVVESVKAAFDIYAPVSGKVVQINNSLEGDPAIVNQDSYGRGFFCQIEMSQSADWDNLLTAEAYEKAIKEGAH